MQGYKTLLISLQRAQDGDKVGGRVTTMLLNGEEGPSVCSPPPLAPT